VTHWSNIKAAAIKQASVGFKRQTAFGNFPAELMLDAIAERRPIHTSLDAANEAIIKRIEAWDIRCAGTLRDLFPLAFPPALRSGRLIAEMNQEGDWVVTKCL
jgi:hypothetical protein